MNSILCLLIATSSPAATIPVLSPLPCVQDDEGDETQLDPLTVACNEFLASPLGVRAALVEEIHQRVEGHEEPAVQRLLALRDQARHGLVVVDQRPPVFHRAEDYAPAQPARRHVNPESDGALDFAHLMGRHGSEPIYVRRVHYDFARNVGVDSGREISPDDHLWNYLYGYVRDCDVLIAWLQKRFDHDRGLDVVAQHFSHSYSTLFGNCHPELSLYDAFSAFEGVDMPDVDVIAYARNVRGDDSWTSPIPPGRRQNALFAQIHEDFLRYYRYRTLIEYVTNLWMNPESPMDWNHESLRERVLYSLHLDDLDIENIQKRMMRVKDRGGFVSEIDRLSASDDSWRWYSRDAARRANQARWAVAMAAQDVLRKHGFLRDAVDVGTGAGTEAETPADD